MPRRDLQLKPSFIAADELTDGDIAALIDIARRQAELRKDLKAALECRDDARALDAARRLVGLERQVGQQ